MRRLRIGVGLAVVLGVVACTEHNTIGTKNEAVTGRACATPGEEATGVDGCSLCECGNDELWLCSDESCSEPEGCSYDGESFADGATFPSTDGCNSCSCDDGDVACTDRACGTCAPGDTMALADGCNTCTCEEGEWACTEEVCEKGCTEGNKEYVHGEIWTCSDGCNTCSCIDGSVETTLIACQEAACEPNGFTMVRGATCQGCFCSADGQRSCFDSDCGHCAHEGAFHANGSTFQNEDCDSCRCEDGNVVCETGDGCGSCTVWDKVYEHGEHWDCDCNVCSCHDGQIGSTNAACSCQPGASMPAGDGCNTCTCVEDENSWAHWSCTELECDFAACEVVSDCPAVPDVCGACGDMDVCQAAACPSGTCMLTQRECEPTSCQDVSDCPDLDPSCESCPNGQQACDAYQCIAGECVAVRPMCAAE